MAPSSLGGRLTLLCPHATDKSKTGQASKLALRLQPSLLSLGFRLAGFCFALRVAGNVLADGLHLLVVAGDCSGQLRRVPFLCLVSLIVGNGLLQISKAALHVFNVGRSIFDQGVDQVGTP